jgi:hypothetical protein
MTPTRLLPIKNDSRNPIGNNASIPANPSLHYQKSIEKSNKLEPEKSEKLKVKNQEYLDKLRYMINYRESQLEEKKRLAQKAENDREERLKKVCAEREKSIKQKKDENKLRNVYFTLQKSRQLEIQKRRISQLKR